MNWDLFAGFCGACLILGLMPGPAAGAITATALTHGTRAAMSTVYGCMLAAALQMALLTGFTASLLHLLKEGMPVIRWAGAAYLLYLGVQTWRHAGKDERPGPDRRDGRNEAPPGAAARRGFVVRGLLVTVTNPKVLAFYAAFFPQFIDASRPLLPQVSIMAVAFLCLMFAIDSLWAVAGGRVFALLRSARARRWRDRASGGVLIGAAAALASLRAG